MTAVLDDTRVFDDIITHGFGDPPTPPAPPEDEGRGGGSGDGSGPKLWQTILIVANVVLFFTVMSFIAAALYVQKIR